MSDADLVIAGGGCAGLSALAHAVAAGPGRRIVVIDADPTPGDDRTWAFWGRADDPFAHLADRSWDDLAVRFPTWSQRRRLVGRSYFRVRRRDYDTALWDLAHRTAEVDVVTAEIVAIDDGPHGATVTTSAGTVSAPTVFQSVRLPPDVAVRPVRHPLRQHFGGWEVVTQHPVFDADVATFMDLDTPQADGLTFFYVLPDAPDRALVEHTVFSATPRARAFYDEHILDHLDRLGAGDVTVQRREYGAIPMEERLLDQRWGRHVWNIGTVGGRTKASTGYTFQRIHAQTRHLAATWARGRVEPLPPPPARYPLADATLLHVLHHRPDLAVAAFEQLFRTLSLDQVLDFLDERSRLVDDLAMMAAMPRLAFLRAGVAEAVAAGSLARAIGETDPAAIPSQ